MDSIRKLCDTIEKFCSYVSGLSDEQLKRAEWGPREVLAHLVFHHQVYVDQLQGSLTGSPVSPPMGTFSELNARASEEYEELTVQALTSRFRCLNDRLIDLYRSCHPAHVAIVIKAGAKIRTLEELIPEVEAHVRNHHHKLCRSLQYQSGN